MKSSYREYSAIFDVAGIFVVRLSVRVRRVARFCLIILEVDAGAELSALELIKEFNQAFRGSGVFRYGRSEYWIPNSVVRARQRIQRSF